ncbi:hypothetical protein CR513_51609, partial [Mucuna pruriens]
MFERRHLKKLGVGGDHQLDTLDICSCSLDILIMCLHVDDLIFTINDLKMIAKFREAMISYFQMICSSLMSYFLGIEVIQ